MASERGGSGLMHQPYEQMHHPQQPEESFSIPYTLDSNSRHDRVLKKMLDREQNNAVVDKTDESFDSATDYVDLFERIVADGQYQDQVLVKEFYLYDPQVEWRDQTAIELDVARFDPDAQTVYCIEPKGRNLESLHLTGEELDRYDVEGVEELSTDEKKRIIVEKALKEGEDTIERLQEYMDRFGWQVKGQIAAFYQYGNRGETEVELYPCALEVEA